MSMHRICVMSVCAGVLLGATTAIAQSPPSRLFITDDLARFYAAFDQAAGQDSATRVRTFHDVYLKPGTPGLHDWAITRLASWDALAPILATRGWPMDRVGPVYMRPVADTGRQAFMRILVPLADSLAAVTLERRTREWQRYYASIRPRVLAMDTARGIAARIEDRLHALQRLMPDRPLLPAYFVVGQGNSGGTTGASGLLIGVEQGSAGPGTPLDELDEATRSMVGDKSPAVYTALVVHEATHMLQARKQQASMLEAVIMEGVADYVASRLVPDGGVLESGHQRFGRANEARVRAAFAADLRAGRDTDRWLYNYGTAGADWVPDLGYFVGFRIAQGYHTRHGGTDAALRRLIAMADARRILRESGYLGGHARARG
jgi:hypothetical protein